QGRVPAFYTPGGHRRFRRADLDAFLARSGPGRQQAGPAVLLVDDDERMRKLVRMELEREGYDVQEAASADEGLASIEARKPELILLDVMMPHVDGWERLGRTQERCAFPRSWTELRGPESVVSGPLRAFHLGSFWREVTVVRSRAAEAGTSAVRPAAKSPLRGCLSLRSLVVLWLKRFEPDRRRGGG